MNATQVINRLYSIVYMRACILNFRIYTTTLYQISLRNGLYSFVYMHAGRHLKLQIMQYNIVPNIVQKGLFFDRMKPSWMSLIQLHLGVGHSTQRQVMEFSSWMSNSTKAWEINSQVLIQDKTETDQTIAHLKQPSVLLSQSLQSHIIAWFICWWSHRKVHVNRKPLKIVDKSWTMWQVSMCKLD